MLGNKVKPTYKTCIFFHNTHLCPLCGTWRHSFSGIGGSGLCRLGCRVWSVGWSWWRRGFGAAPVWWSGSSWCRRRAACWATLWGNRRPAAYTPTGRTPQHGRKQHHLEEGRGSRERAEWIWDFKHPQAFTGNLFRVVPCLFAPMHAVTGFNLAVTERMNDGWMY